MVTHPTMGAVASIAADRAGCHRVTGHLFPMMLPSTKQPTEHVRDPAAPRAAGRAVNRAAWSIGELTIGLLTDDRSVNRFRTRHGVPPVRASMLLGGVSKRRTMVLTSPAYFQPPSDWPSWIRMTGFTVWDGSGAVPPEVDAYLATGDAPVVVDDGDVRGLDCAAGVRRGGGDAGRTSASAACSSSRTRRIVSARCVTETVSSRSRRSAVCFRVARAMRARGESWHRTR